MTTWKFKSCPRCNGDLYISSDNNGWYQWCLQCGYEGDLPHRAKLDQTIAGSQKNQFSRLPGDLPYVPVEDY